ncbi:MAG: sigma-70 family RNA polymerase sigma factor [Polyangiaceae bacterium]|nr:sigma-70 family RNA polymerase sigma factor [Polyangiaceae bacterium]
MQHERREESDASEPAGMSEAERQERLARLVLCRSRLSPDQAALLRDVFPEIVAAHHDLVWDLLRKRGLDGHDAEDLFQEVFLALHEGILENGFVDDVPRMLRRLIKGKVSNHVRARRRSPVSIGLPSSRSEKPRSQADVERALHFAQLAERIFSQLSPEHQEVADLVMLKRLTHADAAAVLGIPEGTLKSRLIAAKRALLAAAEPLLPASQRGPS